MRAILIHEFGGPEVLKLQDIKTPVPAEGQVLVKIRAAGVNPADTYARTGNYAFLPELPFTPGTDGAGVVESTGRGIKNFKPGDRVYLGRSVSGTYAEYALATESQVHMLPGNVTFSQGAGVYVPYATAYHALHHAAGAESGETVLVHGASGGVGIAAVQMARALGLSVYGTAGTPAGLDLVKREGAERVFDHNGEGYRDEIIRATGGKGVDIILEMLANVNLGYDLKMIGMCGRIVVIGSRGDVTVTPRDLMTKRGSVMGIMLWNIAPEEAAEIHTGLEAGLIGGTLRPVIRMELPLSEAPRSHREVMSPGASGKIVLIP
jgi:NADPH2:quinone reductase